MHSFILSTLLLTALTVTAAPTPQAATSNYQNPATLPVELGRNISFPDFFVDPADVGRASPRYVIPVSSSTYNLVFSKYSEVDQPPPQNFFAALIFIQRLFKDRFFNVPRATIITTIADPVIDVKTAGAWLHVENPGKNLRYSTFQDLLTYITYFSLTWNKDRTLFQLVERTTNQPAFTGWLAASNETYASQFP